MGCGREVEVGGRGLSPSLTSEHRMSVLTRAKGIPFSQGT